MKIYIVPIDFGRRLIGYYDDVGEWLKNNPSTLFLTPDQVGKIIAKRIKDKMPITFQMEVIQK